MPALATPDPCDILAEIVAHLGACQIQRIATDDRIIAGHIDVAQALAMALLKAQRSAIERVAA